MPIKGGHIGQRRIDRIVTGSHRRMPIKGGHIGQRRIDRIVAGCHRGAPVQLRDVLQRGRNRIITVGPRGVPIQPGDPVLALGDVIGNVGERLLEFLEVLGLRRADVTRPGLNRGDYPESHEPFLDRGDEVGAVDDHLGCVVHSLLERLEVLGLGRINVSRPGLGLRDDPKADQTLLNRRDQVSARRTAVDSVIDPLLQCLEVLGLGRINVS